jgi:hypothetical protein
VFADERFGEADDVDDGEAAHVIPSRWSPRFSVFPGKLKLELQRVLMRWRG